MRAKIRMLGTHARHATTPFPESQPCITCQGNLGSWRSMANVLYLGDPFAMKATLLPYCEPEQFRAGAGTWGGSPNF
jgi:hypothetical protein